MACRANNPVYRWDGEGDYQTLNVPHVGIATIEAAGGSLRGDVVFGDVSIHQHRAQVTAGRSHKSKYFRQGTTEAAVKAARLEARRWAEGQLDGYSRGEVKNPAHSDVLDFVTKFTGFGRERPAVGR